MRAGSVHVVMRHAIVELPSVNVVTGVHIVVLCVLLVVVRVIPIFLFVILQFSLYSHGILGVVFTSFQILYCVLVRFWKTPNRTMHGNKDWDGSNLLKITETLTESTAS